MRFYLVIFSLILLSFAFGCTPKVKPLTPLETLQVYAKAVRKKDTTQMKLMMSQASLQMAVESAKAENVTVDDIVNRETLFSEGQIQVKYRNVREQEDTASIEIEDALGIWNTIHLIREDGAWKIDKKGFSNQIEKQVEQSNQELDQIINQGRIDESNMSPPANNANMQNSANSNPPPIANSNLETVEDLQTVDDTNKKP
jgi:hypothetical protein